MRASKFVSQPLCIIYSVIVMAVHSRFFLLLLATRCFIINVAIVVVGRLNKYTYLRTNLHPHIHMSMYVNRHVLSCIRMYIFLLSRSTLYQANGLFRFRCVCVSKNKNKPQQTYIPMRVSWLRWGEIERNTATK